VDGVDECAKDEATKSVEWLLSLTKTGADGLKASVRILVSGQRDGVLDVLLESEPAISLEASSRSAGIRQFCEEMSGRIQVKFSTTDALRNLVVSRVFGQAQGMSSAFIHSSGALSSKYTPGMFLYAKIVVDCWDS